MSYEYFSSASREERHGLFPALSEEESAARRQAFMDALPKNQDVWFFGYGSLMWDPGFNHLEAVPVMLDGYHRNFCVLSHRYRGTVEKPGLVLGLDRGGNCAGVAYRVCGRTQLTQVLDYLWVREMVTGVYDPTALTVTERTGDRDTGSRALTCHAFVVNARHPQYVGDWPEEQRAGMIAAACGGRGPNVDYLFNTLNHLEELGVADRGLRRMADLVRAAQANGGRTAMADRL